MLPARVAINARNASHSDTGVAQSVAGGLIIKDKLCQSKINY
jgi:hypothetical protein